MAIETIGHLNEEEIPKYYRTVEVDSIDKSHKVPGKFLLETIKDQYRSDHKNLHLEALDCIV